MARSCAHALSYITALVHDGMSPLAACRGLCDAALQAAHVSAGLYLGSVMLPANSLPLTARLHAPAGASTRELLQGRRRFGGATWMRLAILEEAPGIGARLQRSRHQLRA
jgi:hypothetical protein